MAHKTKVTVKSRTGKVDKKGTKRLRRNNLASAAAEKAAKKKSLFKMDQRARAANKSLKKSGVPGGTFGTAAAKRLHRANTLAIQTKKISEARK
jgi:hypothetical protein